jgi:hypothetical protein
MMVGAELRGERHASARWVPEKACGGQTLHAGGRCSPRERVPAGCKGGSRVQVASRYVGRYVNQHCQRKAVDLQAAGMRTRCCCCSRRRCWGCSKGGAGRVRRTDTATHPWAHGTGYAAAQELEQHDADELQEQGHGKGSAGDGLVGVDCRAGRGVGWWAAAPAGTSSHPKAQAGRLGRCVMQSSTTHRYHHGPCSALRGLHGMPGQRPTGQAPLQRPHFLPDFGACAIGCKATTTQGSQPNPQWGQPPAAGQLPGGCSRGGGEDL